MPSLMPAGILTSSVFCFLIRALAAAGGARLGDDLAGAVAVRAGLLDAEEALAHVHRAGAVAGRAGLGLVPGLAPVPWQVSQVSQLGMRICVSLPRGGFLERDLHRVAQVAAAVDLLAAAAARRRRRCAAEDVAEDVAEGLGEAAEAFRRRRRAAHVRVDAGVAVLVVGRALLRVGQHLVGLLGLLELLLGLLRIVALVAVGVVLHRQLAIGLLDVVLGGVLRHAEDS